jgi:hypothetical protein
MLFDVVQVYEYHEYILDLYMHETAIPFMVFSVTYYSQLC